MRETLSALCESLIQNRDILKSTFKNETTYLYPVCAAIFVNKGQTAEEEKLRFCRDLLKKKTGIFSSFRGIGRLAMISMMAAALDPEQALEEALKLHALLKQYFWGSPYLPFASMVLSQMETGLSYEEIASRTERIYHLMKQQHPFLTSSEDSLFAAVLAVSKQDDQQVVEEMENCYRLLKPEFFSGNAVQSLSHVLALSEKSAEEKCNNTLALFRGLRERGRKYGTDFELATLGVLALLPVEESLLIQDMVEADDFLSRQKGYGILGPGRKQRLMHAGMLVAGDYFRQNESTIMESAAVGSVLALIVAQQAAICMSVVAASSAAAASANS